MADVSGTDAGADVMVDPDKKLTPLQRRRLREGKPFTSRRLNEFQRMAEDELDHQREKHLKTLPNMGTPYVQVKIQHEREDIDDRKNLRNKEHLRRNHLHVQREGELRQMMQAKMENIMDMEEAAMGDEARLQSQRRRERSRVTENLDRKLKGLPPKEEGDYEDEEAVDEEAEEEEKAVAEALFHNEAHRLEMMLDQTVVSEERRLRAMLVRTRLCCQHRHVSPLTCATLISSG